MTDLVLLDSRIPASYQRGVIPYLVVGKLATATATVVIARRVLVFRFFVFRGHGPPTPAGLCFLEELGRLAGRLVI